MVFIFYHVALLVVVFLFQESCFGAVGISEHTKEIKILIKDMCDYHFERVSKMSILILHLINHYIIMLIIYLNS